MSSGHILPALASITQRVHPRKRLKTRSFVMEGADNNGFDSPRPELVDATIGMADLLR